jgi:hypothetical protein
MNVRLGHVSLSVNIIVLKKIRKGFISVKENQMVILVFFKHREKMRKMTLMGFHKSKKGSGAPAAFKDDTNFPAYARR